MNKNDFNSLIEDVDNNLDNNDCKTTVNKKVYDLSSTKIDNKGKDILIFGKDRTQGLGKRLLSAEKMYSVNFTKENAKL